MIQSNVKWSKNILIGYCICLFKSNNNRPCKEGDNFRAIKCKRKAKNILVEILVRFISVQRKAIWWMPVVLGMIAIYNLRFTIYDLCQRFIEAAYCQLPIDH
jgi:hypothetical protein